MSHTSAIGPVLAGVYATLNTSTMTTAVAGKTVTVANDWPQTIAAPACIIRVDSESRELDTMGKPGKSVVVNLHLLSDYQGQSEIQAMSAAAMCLLHYSNVTVSGHDLVSVQSESAYDAGIEDAGQDRQHWVLPFRVDVKQS